MVMLGGKAVALRVPGIIVAGAVPSHRMAFMPVRDGVVVEVFQKPTVEETMTWQYVSA